MRDENGIALPPGFELDQFRIEGVLGQGGFGITYLAHDMKLNWKVVIKEYMPVEVAVRKTGNDVGPRTTRLKENYDWGKERFLAEASNLARFRGHPYIVQILSFFERNGTAYIVMDYEEGHSLDVHLKSRGGTLPAEELLTIALALLNGLEAVHKIKLLHRDIKPQNILLRVDGRPLLLDFGTARMAFSGRTQAMTAVLTRGYAPIEQYHEDGNQGEWSDIYGLGAVLYTCISGRAPPEAVTRVCKHPDPLEPAVIAGRGRYPGELLKAVDRSLGMHAEDRPQSVVSWRKMFPTPEELAKWRQGIERPRRRSWGWRHRAFALTGVALVTLVAIVGLILTGRMFDTDNNAENAPINGTSAKLENQQPSVEPWREIGIVAGSTPEPLRIRPPNDPDGNPLTIKVVELPERGRVLLGNDTVVEPNQELSAGDLATLVYHADPDDPGGSVRFAYRVDDGRGGTADGSLGLNVSRQFVKVEPPRTFTVVNGLDAVPLAIAPPTGPKDRPLRVTVEEVPAFGSVRSDDRALKHDEELTVEALSGLTYSAPSDQAGSAGAFRYRVEDEGASSAKGSATGSIAIEVTPVHHRPEVEQESVFRVPLNAGTMPLDIRPPRDPDGGVLTVKVTQVPNHGAVVDGIHPARIGDSLSVNQLTTLGYQPRTNYDGEAGWFRYLVTNHNGGRTEAGARIEVASGALTEEQLDAIQEEFSIEERQGVQRLLQRLGHYAGPVDGSFEESTVEAIRAFQNANGLPQTGHLSFSQRRLLHEHAAASALSELAAVEASWDEPERARVQHGLELLGHYSGPRNGVIDAATRVAIRAFQATLGAPQTGFLSSDQRLALAIAAAESAAERAERAAYDAQVAAARDRLAVGPDGAIPHADGAIYYGETDPGRRLRHGLGVLVRPDGQRYEGEWVNDFPSGVGVHHGGDGTRYAGEWNQSLPSGYGVQSAPAAGSRVAGEWNPGLDTARSHVNGYAVFIPSSGQREQRGIWRNSRLLIPLFQP